jgi:hypothetical protein
MRPRRFLTITIDTEEDNWGEYDRSWYSVENVARIPRLHRVFARHGVRATYLITHPVATDPRARDILGSLQRAGECEIGTHLHPWNTPPLTEEKTRRNSFISNLDSDLQFRKIQSLHETIERNFGVAPGSYRSGRWGFDERVAANLIRLGYAVDTSVYPTWDWSAEGGPDFSGATLEPYMYRSAAADPDKNRSLLEVPATIDYVQDARPAAHAVTTAIRRHAPAADKVLAVLARARVLNHLCLSPELARDSHMIRLAGAVLRRGVRVVNMFFHSPSLLPGASPFVRTEHEFDTFLARIERFVAYAMSVGLTSVGMSELSAEDLGVVREQVL